MLAAIAARTVAGSSSSPASSVTEATSSSRNSGFPSACTTTRSIAAGPPRAAATVATVSARSSRERLERMRGLRDHARRPTSTGFEQLGPRERDVHHARFAHVGDEVVDQLEERSRPPSARPRTPARSGSRVREMLDDIRIANSR